MTEADAQKRKADIAAANAAARAAAPAWHEKARDTARTTLVRNLPGAAASLVAAAVPGTAAAYGATRGLLYDWIAAASRAGAVRSAAARKAVASAVAADRIRVKGFGGVADAPTKAAAAAKAARRTIEKNEALLKDPKLPADKASSARAEIDKARKDLPRADAAVQAAARLGAAGAREAATAGRRRPLTFEEAYASAEANRGYVETLQASARSGATEAMFRDPRSFAVQPPAPPSLPKDTRIAGFGSDILSFFLQGAPRGAKGRPGIGRPRTYDANAVERRFGTGPALRYATEGAAALSSRVTGGLARSVFGIPDVGPHVPAPSSTGSTAGNLVYGLLADVGLAGGVWSAMTAAERWDELNARKIADAEASAPTVPTDMDSFRGYWDASVADAVSLARRIAADSTPRAQATPDIETYRNRKIGALREVADRLTLMSTNDLAAAASVDDARRYNASVDATNRVEFIRAKQTQWNALPFRQKRVTPEPTEAAYFGETASPAARGEFATYLANFGRKHVTPMQMWENSVRSVLEPLGYGGEYWTPFQRWAEGNSILNPALQEVDR